MIHIELPLPPTNNLYYRHARGYTYLSPKAKDFKEVVRQKFMELGLVCPDTEQHRITIMVHSRMNKDGTECKRRADIDAYIKATLDSLQGIIYEDDKQVYSLSVQFASPVLNGALELFII